MKLARPCGRRELVELELGGAEEGEADGDEGGGEAGDAGTLGQ